MNEELQKMLRSLLREELDVVTKRLDTVDKRLDNIENRLENMENRLDMISKDVEVIKVGQETMQQNLIDSLGQYTEEIISYVDDKTEALNKRLYRVESDLERFKRQ